MRLLVALGALLLVGGQLACERAPTPISGMHSAGVNIILGDSSFEARYGYPVPAGFDDDARVRIHLEYVAELLRDRSTAGLSPALVAARRRNLDRLAAYASRGIFPKNDDHPDKRRPTFIDARGRICAVGYLLAEDLGREAAEEIAARQKYAFVREIDSPRLAAWLATSGLTLDELELIQPTYDYPDTAAPVPPFATLDRVDGQSRIVGGLGLPVGGLSSSARTDLFAQYFFVPSTGWGVGVYSGIALTGASPSNTELGGVYTREFPMLGRLALRTGLVLPTAGDDDAGAALDQSAVAHRLADAILFQRQDLGVRLGASPIVSIRFCRSLHIGMDCHLRADLGLDLRLSPEAGGRTTPRTGLGLGIYFPFAGFTLEHVMARLAPNAVDEARVYQTLAVSLRFNAPRRRWHKRSSWQSLQPGVSAVFPIGENTPTWVFVVDLHFLFGSATHDQSYW